MKRALLSGLVGVILLGGCAQKVQIHALQPAKIDRASQTKTIAVNPFRHDSVALASKIEAALASKRIDNQNYFTMISRNDINRILDEQRLQSSGLLNESKSVELGELVGAQALISGEIGLADSHDSFYREKRTRCLDKKCTEVQEYMVHCTRRDVMLSAQIRMVDIARGDIIYTDTFHQKRAYARCSDESHALPAPGQALQRLAVNIADDFAYQLTPHYVTFNVELLDEPYLELTDEQESLLENALLYIKRQRYDKAEDLLERLLQSTGDQSVVAAYNLGVMKEVRGELEEARQLYRHADQLTIEPVNAIDAAILRINESIENSERAQEQLAR